MKEMNGNGDVVKRNFRLKSKSVRTPKHKTTVSTSGNQKPGDFLVKCKTPDHVSVGVNDKLVEIGKFGKFPDCPVKTGGKEISGFSVNHATSHRTFVSTKTTGWIGNFLGP
jgi:hypothetical protein